MNWVHKEFQLNGRSYPEKEELISYSEEIAVPLHHFLQDWFAEDDFILVKTSGSTGVPKNIRIKKEHMKNSALATGNFFHVKAKTKALCCLPLDFIAGKMMLVRAMTLGWHLDVVEPDSKPLKNIQKQYDFCAMVPLQLSNSLDKIHYIDKLIVGGGVVSHSLERVIQNLSTKVYATYGMTETITHIAVKSLNLPLRGSITKQSHYKTLPDISIATDERNCLVINASRLSDKQIITNDVVEIISPTEFQWKGRYDNVINSGGIKLYPEEIEKKLTPYIKSRFFIAGIPDEKLGEKLALIIEEKITSNAVEKSLYLTIKNVPNLTKFERPKEIFFVSEFEETQTGKIRRKEILKRILS